MSTVLLAILTGGLALPEVSTDFLRSSFPKIGSQTLAEFFVDPEDTVLSCELLHPDLGEDHAKRRCDEMLGETFGEPAMDLDGNPTYGVTTIHTVKQASGAPSPRLRLEAYGEPDLEIVVSRLPRASDQHDVLLSAYLDEEGRVQGCRQVPNQDFELSGVACSEAMRHRFEPRDGGAGIAVPYVDLLRVTFVLEDDLASLDPV